ncbi:hypothetical protein K6119_08110 [Paracrocinitomix mangrovi]|uniref:hypothetical protein n=1 Tax=Paracrocinitomix mangrovi TaxID=2862509 RepID=UPI001C8E7C46|nr:hypothetical protein [Paracrocinitomix mangrovi]UKN03476.1 hypothetical protein K6119_08110 [Paracrocinitomix mangrovi]
MKLILSALLLFPLIAFNQMNSQDSLLNSQAQWLAFDCYDSKGYRIFLKYSNGQESYVIYNLEDKDSIVKYYYSGQIATIGLYYGCQRDTLWSTNFTELKPGKDIPSPMARDGKTVNPDEYIVKIDSTEYAYYTGYQFSYSPIYEITVFNEEEKIIERKWKGRSAFIDFKTVQRDSYIKPE